MEECATCKWFADLPFAEEFICMNENSDYADCPCNPKDTCTEWESKDE